MDNAMKYQALTALKDAEDSRNSLIASKEKLMEHYKCLKNSYMEHIALIESQSKRKLDEFVKRQTREIESAERQVRESIGPKGKVGDLNQALRRLTACSDVSLEFEISPDLDRLRFLSEFGILRVRDTPASAMKGKKAVRFRPASEILQRPSTISSDSSEKEKDTGNIHTSENLEDEAEDLTTDSGFLVVSSRVAKDAKDTQSQTGQNPPQFENTKPEVTSKASDEFVTMGDGRIVAFSTEKGNVMLLNKECRVLSEYQVEHPKAMCQLSQDSVLVVVETPTHDKILPMKVVGNDLVKKNAIRIKCHDRICEITRKGKSIYVMCSGDHLHMLDT